MKFMPETNYPGPVLKDPCLWAIVGYVYGFMFILWCVL